MVSHERNEMTNRISEFSLGHVSKGLLINSIFCVGRDGALNLSRGDEFGTCVGGWGREYLSSRFGFDREVGVEDVEDASGDISRFREALLKEEGGPVDDRRATWCGTWDHGSLIVSNGFGHACQVVTEIEGLKARSLAEEVDDGGASPQETFTKEFKRRFVKHVSFVIRNIDEEAEKHRTPHTIEFVSLVDGQKLIIDRSRRNTPTIRQRSNHFTNTLKS